MNGAKKFETMRSSMSLSDWTSMQQRRITSVQVEAGDKRQRSQEFATEILEGNPKRSKMGHGNDAAYSLPDDIIKILLELNGPGSGLGFCGTCQSYWQSYLRHRTHIRSKICTPYTLVAHDDLETLLLQASSPLDPGLLQIALIYGAQKVATWLYPVLLKAGLCNEDVDLALKLAAGGEHPLETLHILVAAGACGSVDMHRHLCLMAGQRGQLGVVEFFWGLLNKQLGERLFERVMLLTDLVDWCADENSAEHIFSVIHVHRWAVKTRAFLQSIPPIHNTDSLLIGLAARTV